MRESIVKTSKYTTLKVHSGVCAVVLSAEFYCTTVVSYWFNPIQALQVFALLR